jgi:hypothetical protein
MPPIMTSPVRIAKKIPVQWVEILKALSKICADELA